MPRAESEHTEGRIHTESIETQHGDVQARFRQVVTDLLKDAPNNKSGDYFTDYDGERPTYKEMSFGFRNARVTASYSVDLGTPPTYDLDIEVPIVIDNLKAPGFKDPHHPIDPHEIVSFRGSPFYRSLDVDAKAVNRLGDHGWEIPVSDYTAGGLLPPIQTIGRGKLQTFESVIALFQGVIPENPQYREPLLV